MKYLCNFYFHTYRIRKCLVVFSLVVLYLVALIKPKFLNLELQKVFWISFDIGYDQKVKNSFTRKQFLSKFV